MEAGEKLSPDLGLSEGGAASGRRGIICFDSFHHGHDAHTIFIIFYSSENSESSCASRRRDGQPANLSFCRDRRRAFRLRDSVRVPPPHLGLAEKQMIRLVTLIPPYCGRHRPPSAKIIYLQVLIFQKRTLFVNCTKIGRKVCVKFLLASKLMD